MIQVHVLYPAADGNTFNHEYYATTHFKLVGELLGPMKLRGGTLHKALAGGAPGVAAPYLGGGSLLFDTVEDFQAGMAKHGEAIMGDLPNFTNAQPVIYIAEITAGG